MDREFVRMVHVAERYRGRVELECKLFREETDEAFWRAAAAQIRTAFPHREVSHLVRFQQEDGTRVEVAGEGNIAKVGLQGGRLADVAYTVMYKTRWNDYLAREGIAVPEDLVIASDTLDFVDFPARATLRAEIPMKKTLDAVPADALVRVINRVSYSNPSLPWRIDLSRVRSSKKSLADALLQYTTIECEMEYVPGTTTATPDPGIYEAWYALLLPLLQTQQHSKFVLTEPERKRYAEEFRHANIKWVDPMTFTRATLAAIQDDYTVTDKADGLRCALFVADNGKLLRIDKNSRVEWTGITAPKHVGWVLDGEYLAPLNRFLAFDVMRSGGGRDVTHLPLYDADAEDAGKLSAYRLGNMQLFLNSESTWQRQLGATAIEAKHFEYASGVAIFAAADAALSVADRAYHTDGLIFTPAREPYKPGAAIFKWKPPQENTIDFLVLDPPGGSMPGIRNGRPCRLVHLYVGTAGERWIYPLQQLVGLYATPELDPERGYIKTLFTPRNPPNPDAYLCYLYTDPDEPSVAKSADGARVMSNTIVEFAYDPASEDWQPLRTRQDKTLQYRKKMRQYGNNFRVADEIWTSIHYPVTEEMIRRGAFSDEDVMAQTYYKEGARSLGQLSPMLRFHREVKGTLYAAHARGRTLLEIGVGRAGDLPRWIAVDVRSVVGIDADLAGLNNAIDGAAVRVLQKELEGVKVPPAVFVYADASKSLLDPAASAKDDLALDLLSILGGTKPAMTPQLRKFEGAFQRRFDVVSCQFALHYFFANKETLDAFLTNIDQLVTTNGGIFMGTIPDGATVYSELLARPELTVTDPKTGSTLVSFRREYDEATAPAWTDTEANLGMPISVQYESFGAPTREYLIPFGYLTQRLTELGFTLVDASMFRDIAIPERLLVPPELQPISFLHRVFVFRRNPPPPVKRTLRRKAAASAAE